MAEWTITIKTDPRPDDPELHLYQVGHEVILPNGQDIQITSDGLFTIEQIRCEF